VGISVLSFGGKETAHKRFAHASLDPLTILTRLQTYRNYVIGYRSR